VVRRRCGEFGDERLDAARGLKRQMRRTVRVPRDASRMIGVGRGGERGATGCEDTHRGRSTRRPQVDTWGSGCTVDLERGGAAGCSPGADAPRSSDHHDDVLRRGARRMMVAPPHREPRWRVFGHDVCRPRRISSHAAWGVSPRRAALRPHQRLFRRCGLSPRCQPGVDALHNLETPLPTPMHHADRRFPPR
jgi:hypothetical protein